MGSTLNSIVAVNISLKTAAAQQKGFGRGLIVGASNRMGSDLFRVYSSPESVADDFLTTDKEYIAATAYFAQEPAPPDVMIGYTPTSAVAQVEVVTVVTATNSFNYTVTLNGETATFLSDSSATAAEIVTGLISAINALSGAAAYTAAAITSVTDRFKITSDVAGTAFTLALGTTKLSKDQFNMVVVDTATDAFEYVVTIDGQEASYTADADATVTEIQTGLVAAISALTGENVTPAAVSTDRFSLVQINTAIPFVVQINTTKLSIQGTTKNATGGIAAGLNAILNVGGKSWYGLIVSHTRAAADLEAAAAWCEAASYDYIYIACSADADVLTSVSSDVLSILKAATYLRTGYIWSDDQAHFPDAAWMGEEFPNTPGSSNWAYKALAGIAVTDPSVLTDSKVTIIEGKNGNYYMTVGGVPITQKGIMAGGQWIDVVIGRDWLKARIQEEVFNVLINAPKVGFDDPGIGLLANALRGVLTQGIENGILASFDIDVPLASDFSSAQKATRVLPSIPWTAVLKGAIDNLTITGSISA